MAIRGLDTVYTDLINKINTITDSNGEYLFKKVAIFNNQVKRFKTGGLEFNFPSCFIEVKVNDGYSLGDQYTCNELGVTFYISNWELDSSLGSFDQNFNIFTLRDLVKKELTNFQPSGCGCMQWNGDKQQFDHESVYTFKAMFKCHYIDIISNPIANDEQYYYTGATASLIVGVTYSSTV